MTRPGMWSALIAGLWLGLGPAGCRPTQTPSASVDPVAGSEHAQDEGLSKVSPGDRALPVRKYRGSIQRPPRGFQTIQLTDDELKRAQSLQGWIAEAAALRNVDPYLLNAIIWHESRFTAKAKNPSGAKGLMQLMPKTSRAMAKKLDRPNRPLDPEFSIHAGALLLDTLLEMFDDDVELALFGYARGSGNVRAWKKRRERKYPERVQKFIRKIRSAQWSFQNIGLHPVTSSADA